MTIFLNSSTAIIADVAPNEFAKKSIMSPLLVKVYSLCKISIVIPKKVEKIKESNNGLKSSAFLNCFLKYKNHRKLKPK